MTFVNSLGGLVGTQRKNAEHAIFASHFERRASSMKRLHDAKAKTCAEDHATPFCAALTLKHHSSQHLVKGWNWLWKINLAAQQLPSSFVKFCCRAFVARGSGEYRRQIVRKSTKIHHRPIQNRRKINLEVFWAPRVVSGMRPDTLGTAFGHPNAAPKPILGSPSEPRAGKSRTKASLGHPADTPRPSRWAVRTPVVHRAALNTPSDRFLVAFMLSRKSSDVPRVLVCTVSCWVRTN